MILSIILWICIGLTLLFTYWEIKDLIKYLYDKRTKRNTKKT